MAAKRGKKPSLSREQILAVALQIADEQGLEKLTIRRIASALNASPMGIYRYFDNKAAIVRGILDVVVQQSRPTDHSEPDWRQWIRVTFSRMRAALVAHRGVLPLLGTSASFGPGAIQEMEAVLGVLRRSGLGPEAAASGFYSLISYTIGSAMIESGVRQQMAAMMGGGGSLAERFKDWPLEEFPHTVEAAPHMGMFLEEEQFLVGLDRILAGVQ